MPLGSIKLTFAHKYEVEFHTTEPCCPRRVTCWNASPLGRGEAGAVTRTIQNSSGCFLKQTPSSRIPDPRWLFSVATVSNILFIMPQGLKTFSPKVQKKDFYTLISWYRQGQMSRYVLRFTVVWKEQRPEFKSLILNQEVYLAPLRVTFKKGGVPGWLGTWLSALAQAVIWGSGDLRVMLGSALGRVCLSLSPSAPPHTMLSLSLK